MTSQTRRFRDAHQIIDPGACNPSGVARALVQAIDECWADGEDPRYDPACRLICYQLAHLLGMEPLGTSYADYGSDRIDSYRADVNLCQRLAALTPEQLRTLREKWEARGQAAQDNQPSRTRCPTWTDFLRGVNPVLGGGGAVSVPWAGMWLCVETDGYCHT